MSHGAETSWITRCIELQCYHVWLRVIDITRPLYVRSIHCFVKSIAQTSKILFVLLLWTKAIECFQLEWSRVVDYPISYVPQVKSHLDCALFLTLKLVFYEYGEAILMYWKQMQFNKYFE
jgi:hypothetical protein